MSSVNSWSQKQVLSIDTTSMPFLYDPPEAVPNWNGRSVPFQPCPLPRSEFTMIQDLHSQNHQILKSEFSTNQSSLSVARHLPGSQSRVIQGLHPAANQLFVNGPNVARNLNLLQHQPSNSNCAIRALHPPTDQMIVNQSKRTTYLQHYQQSSEYAEVVQNFNSETYELFLNESNISQQHGPLKGQLPSSAIRPNLNEFNQQLPVSLSQSKYPPTYVPSLSEFTRNQEKYQSDHRQSERESTMRHSTDRLGMLHNQCIPVQQSIGNQGTYPLTANIPIPKMGFNLNEEPSMSCLRNSYPQSSDTSKMNLPQNLYPQYSEKVHICLIGPPGCGKADLIRTFGRRDNIRKPTDKQLSKVCQQELIGFGTTFTIDVWYAHDLTLVADDLRPLCQYSKSAIVLVYSIAQESTLTTVLEWIKGLKSDTAVNVPILLAGNTTGADTWFASKKILPNNVRFSDGVRVKEKYDLEGYYEFSSECITDAETIFIIAAFRAFSRMIQI